MDNQDSQPSTEPLVSDNLQVPEPPQNDPVARLQEIEEKAVGEGIDNLIQKVISDADVDQAQPLTNEKIEESTHVAENDTVQGEVVEPVKQEETGIPLSNNPTGKGGFADHPELINKEGRPKRKTLLEMINERLDKPLPSGKLGNEALADTIVGLLVGKRIKIKSVDGEGKESFTEKIVPPDKEMIKEYWHYNDGMPNQAVGNLLDRNGQAKPFVVRNTNYSNAIDEPTVAAVLTEGETDGGTTGNPDTV